MTTPRTVTVANDAPLRLDVFVQRALPAVSRRVARRLIDDGDVRVNERRAAKGTLVRSGDRITLPDLAGLVPEPDLPVTVCHEDALLVVLDKPGAMPSHALDPRQRGTAAAFLLGRYPEMAAVGDALAPGLVHRLDTGTSGLLLAARTPEAHAAVRADLRAHRIEKRYRAVVAGCVEAPTTVDVALAHDPRDARRMIPATPGLRAWPAASTIVPLAGGPERSLVEVTIRTGVTHQVRVHLALAGHPVIGDLLYGGPPAELPPGRHALHAAAMSLPHPADGRPVALEVPLPAELRALVP